MTAQKENRCPHCNGQLKSTKEWQDYQWECMGCGRGWQVEGNKAVPWYYKVIAVNAFVSFIPMIVAGFLPDKIFLQFLDFATLPSQLAVIWFLASQILLVCLGIFDAIKSLNARN